MVGVNSLGMLQKDEAKETWVALYDPGAPWWAWFVGLGLIAGFGFLVWRGRRQAHLYRVESALEQSDLERVHETLIAAEKQTVGEILPVVLGRSDRYPDASLLAGCLSAICAYLCVWALPVPIQALGLFVVALAAGICGWFLTNRFPELRRNFVPPWRLQEMAEEQAFQEFHRQGLHRTEKQTGVLLFVSLFERRVIVLGDEGIDAVVKAKTWEEIDAIILDAARRGELGTGIVQAIERIGSILAESFPWTDGDRNEVPDRVIVRPE